MKAAEREERNARILQLFVGGATYRQILVTLRADAAERDRPKGWALSSTGAVHSIVQQELAASAARRTLLTDEALALQQERTERLFAAHWPKALQGDHRSAEICRRILSQQGRMYGLEGPGGLPAPTGKLPTGAGGGGEEPEEDQDELAELRAARFGA